MMRYEQGVCLKEAGKSKEAREIFDALAKEQPETDEGMKAAWRIAQGDREAMAGRLIEARRRAGLVKKPAEKEAAAKELDEATEKLRGWVDATRTAAAAMKGNGEGPVRLNYELAWGLRVLGDLEVAEARAKVGSPPTPGIAIPGPGAGDAGVKVMGDFGDVVVAEGVEWVPLQASEIAARDAYHAAIAAGDKGGVGEREAANWARLDLGEMLAQRGLVDEAMDLFTEVLEQGLSGGIGFREAIRPRLRIAACLLAKGKAEDALTQINLTVRPRSGQLTAEGRYLGGEAYAQLDQWRKVMVTLRPFEEATYPAGEIGDRAMLRLGEALQREGLRNEAKYVFAAMLKKYPRSPLVKEARLRMTMCEVEESAAVKIDPETLRVRRRGR
jgi:tetratricopeptide (TPR) repeat protein